MTTAPTPPKPTAETEDPAKARGDASTKEGKASWFTFRRTMVVGSALSIGWGAGVLAGRWLGWWDEGASGTFGDSFAPLLGLLTVAALAAALDSVRMQREELQLQRRELELTREEMKAQREAAQAQAAEVRRANELAETSHRIAEKANDLAARDQWIALHQAITNTEQSFSAYGDARYFISLLPEEKQYESLAHLATKKLLSARREMLVRMLHEVSKDVDLPEHDGTR